MQRVSVRMAILPLMKSHLALKEDKIQIRNSLRVVSISHLSSPTQGASHASARTKLALSLKKGLLKMQMLMTSL